MKNVHFSPVQEGSAFFLLGRGETERSYSERAFLHAEEPPVLGDSPPNIGEKRTESPDVEGSIEEKTQRCFVRCPHY
jgi:hypothetical protein